MALGSRCIISSMSFSIRRATRKELEIAIEWAAAEGWNPGLYDADAFYATDPQGFLMGFLDDEPISSISAVSYGDAFGFIGFYIVKPEQRGKGYGYQIWKAAMKYLDTQTIGLDGVLTQQPTYKLSGFTLAYRNIRYEGKGSDPVKAPKEVVPLSTLPFDTLLAYDSTIFPTSRPQFLKQWVKQPKSVAIGFVKSGKLLGYGMVRPCGVGYKVGPLFADSEAIADVLFKQLRGCVGKGNSIFLDVPELNKEAMALAKRYKMTPMFETARMYIRKAPVVPLHKIFGVTTFELG